MESKTIVAEICGLRNNFLYEVFHNVQKPFSPALACPRAQAVIGGTLSDTQDRLSSELVLEKCDQMEALHGTIDYQGLYVCRGIN